ncbi:MAG: DNA mismatch repair endonuclease MutL [Candidatus Omnitrophica bacterium]|nr:DNA mismatch repair endonuclease MutL [Candidatus Omnitrophota bacterium]
MGLIKILPEIIANKISAGEVIERPASIIKELVENSMDAGASSIEIEIQHGGKSLIRVADDGCGMSGEDAETAFARHATSKISEIEDLDSIASYGFRGEALPSIAAVSRTLMQTRSSGAKSGTEIRIEGGHVQSVKETSCREGTIIEVRDLFFNTPARRKFLRTDATELGHVVDIVSHLALSAPQIRFVLKSSKKTIFDLLKTDNLLERAIAIYGEDHAKHLIKMLGQGTHTKVWGVIGKPHVARANRSGQILFVNKRLIKSTSLSYALQDGYHGLLMHGQYPVAVLFVEVDPAKVDVNVHPTKQEVRISNQNEVRSLIKRTVTEALMGEPDLAPELRIKPVQSSSYTQPATSKISLPVKEKISGDEWKKLFEKETAVAAQDSGEASWIPPAVEAEALSEPISVRDQLKITKILGQIHNTFIVAETDEGMIVVDQHAAHEKVMFEALVKNFESGKPQKQMLLMEEVLEVHPRQSEIIKNYLPLLNRLGFEMDEFGENSFAVRSHPAALKDTDTLKVLRDFIDQKEDHKIHTDLENFREEVAALIACKRQSVKAHDPMTPQAMQNLLERLAQCDNPFACPHGRPAFFKQTFLDLEKQFKRK